MVGNGVERSSGEKKLEGSGRTLDWLLGKRKGPLGRLWCMVAAGGNRVAGGRRGGVSGESGGDGDSKGGDSKRDGGLVGLL